MLRKFSKLVFTLLRFARKKLLGQLFFENNMPDLWDNIARENYKLNFQQPTVSWKLFSSRFINAVMAAHASRITEYGRAATNNNLTLGSGITQYASTDSVWKDSFENVQICLSFELTARNV